MKLPIIGAVILLSSWAAGRTTIESSWTDRAHLGPPLDRLAVVALFDTRADSLAFERSATDYLAMHGVATVPAHELLTPAAIEMLDETEIRERLAATDVDGILIFRLLAVDERSEYQVPGPHPPDAPSDGANGNAYSWPSRQSAPVTRSQGYWIEQDFLVAETALFDNRNDRLLWTAKSETLDDAHSRRTSESIVRTIARQLFAMNLIARMDADVPSDAAHTLQRG
jgi:hypothetical protein